MHNTGNVYANLPDATKDEIIDVLAAMQGRNVRIERIVSEGQASPPGFWYDQPWDEWVVVIRGGAEVAFEDPASVERLTPGDWLLIPAGQRHRVESTWPGTLWLAVHGDSADTAPA
ncbi:MAG: cupin domain-containing protein [Planctomycetaceae bacterium]|nr:cupin domain-containing protein [Planctomycetaceae bacterium]